MLRITRGGPKRLTIVMMFFTGFFSAFMNNTTVAAMFVAPMSNLARKAGISSSKLLIPLAYAAIMGGTCTLIGTSTNVAVSAYLAHSGLTPLGLFEIAPIGLAVLATGTLFMVFVGGRLLPDHRDDAATDAAEMRNHIAELIVLPVSPLVGEPVSHWDRTVHGIRLLEILRVGKTVTPGADTILAAGDTLVVEGRVEDLRSVLAIDGLTFKAQVDPNGIGGLEASERDEVSVAEAIILPGSELCGSTTGEVQFSERYGLNVLAVHRSGHRIVMDRAHTRLREGDVLLLHGRIDRIQALLNPGSRVRQIGNPVGDPAARAGSRGQEVMTMAIFLAAIICATSGLLPIAVAFLSAAVLVILCGYITIEKAYEFIDWRLLILVGGMTAFGAAMEKTGAADMLAGWIVRGLAPLGITALLAGFFVLTIVLTQPMSNAAAALVVLPISISAAESLDANPRTFAITVMLAASLSFITPLEPACVLVYGAGKYRFRDFFVVGGLLTLLLSVVVLAMIPVLWEL